MVIEAIKKDDGYFIPINGKKDKIRVYIEEDIHSLDITSLFKNISQNSNYKELSKDEFKKLYGEELYRKYLLLDKKSMEENWEYLVTTQKDFGDNFEVMQEAISHWSKE